MGLWITQVVAIGPVYLAYFWIRSSGLDPISEKDSGFDAGCFIWYSEQALESLIRQVAGGGDTKAGGIIPQWTEIRRRGHEASRYYPTMAREVRSGPMGYPFRPDEDVRNLSGGVCNTPVPHRGVWRL